MKETSESRLLFVHQESAMRVLIKTNKTFLRWKLRGALWAWVRASSCQKMSKWRLQRLMLALNQLYLGRIQWAWSCWKQTILQCRYKDDQTRFQNDIKHLQSELVQANVQAVTEGKVSKITKASMLLRLIAQRYRLLAMGQSFRIWHRANCASYISNQALDYRTHSRSMENGIKVRRATFLLQRSQMCSLMQAWLNWIRSCQFSMHQNVLRRANGKAERKFRSASAHMLQMFACQGQKRQLNRAFQNWRLFGSFKKLMTEKAHHMETRENMLARDLARTIKHVRKSRIQRCFKHFQRMTYLKNQNEGRVQQLACRMLTRANNNCKQALWQMKLISLTDRYAERNRNLDIAQSCQILRHWGLQFGNYTKRLAFSRWISAVRAHRQIKAHRQSTLVLFRRVAISIVDRTRRVALNRWRENIFWRSRIEAALQNISQHYQRVTLNMAFKTWGVCTRETIKLSLQCTVKQKKLFSVLRTRCCHMMCQHFRKWNAVNLSVRATNAATQSSLRRILLRGHTRALSLAFRQWQRMLELVSTRQTFKRRLILLKQNIDHIQRRNALRGVLQSCQHKIGSFLIPLALLQ